MLVGAVTETGDALLGRDAGELVGAAAVGVPLTDERSHGLHAAQVAVDFTLPTVTEANLRACVEHGTALVIGTTGLEQRQQRAMEKAAHEIPIVYARNMSVGVNVFMELVARAAKALGDGYDVEIAETHHRHKVDAPSGTALALGERVAARARPQARRAGRLRAPGPDRPARARHDRLFGRRAAATSSASTPCVSSAPRKKSSSRIAPAIARRSPAARCAPRVGRPARRRACTRWPTCSDSRATEASESSAHRQRPRTCRSFPKGRATIAA